MVMPLLRSVAIIVTIIAYLPPVWLATRLGKKNSKQRLVQRAYKTLARIAGLRIVTVGQPCDARPLLLVSNHISYFDIMVLGAALPVRFTPKADIRSWQVIGSLCGMLGCIFIDRNSSAAPRAKDDISAALAEGDIVSLFPEATTGDGVHLQPFRSAMFSVAEGGNTSPVWVQPAVIEYTDIWKLPIDSEQWTQIAWYGDMDLLPHLWNALKIGSIGVRLTFLPPVATAGADRKQLAARCQEAIAHHLDAGKRMPVAQKTASPAMMFAWLRSKP